MDGSVTAIYRPDRTIKWTRPLVMASVPAGFPSRAEDYVEGRIDLNREIIKHPLSTFYVKVAGDSMIGAGIHPGALLVVDRAVETNDGHIIVARINDELCVKRLSIRKDGRVRLLSENTTYPPIEITEEVDFEVWGRVMFSIHSY